MIASLTQLFSGTPVNLVYSEEVQKGKSGETGVYRSPLTKSGFKETFVHKNGKEIKTLQDMFLASTESFKDQKLLGTRNVITNQITYITYGEALQMASDFGSGLINLGLVYNANKEFKDYNLNLIGIMTKNRYEWVITEFANLLYKNTMAPM